MESYGAQYVCVTDSGRRLLMNGVRDRVRAYRESLDADTEIGIRAHGTCLCRRERRRRVEKGVTRVDASLAGQGAAVGDTPLEGILLGDRPASPKVRVPPVRPAG